MVDGNQKVHCELALSENMPIFLHHLVKGYYTTQDIETNWNTGKIHYTKRTWLFYCVGMAPENSLNQLT